MSIIKQLNALCLEHNVSISVAESCTSGLIASALSSISGSSKYFKGGVIAYHTDIKIDILNISRKLIIKKTEVSHEVVAQMAKSSLLQFNSHFSVATTGYAGPTGGTRINPVGTVYLAVSSKEETVSKHFVFTGDRESVVNQSVVQGARFLMQELKNKQ